MAIVQTAGSGVDVPVLRIGTQSLLQLPVQRIARVRQLETGGDDLRVIQAPAQEGSVNREVLGVELIQRL